MFAKHDLTNNIILLHTSAALSSCCTQQGIRVNRRFDRYNFVMVHQMENNEKKCYDEGQNLMGCVNNVCTDARDPKI